MSFAKTSPLFDNFLEAILAAILDLSMLLKLNHHESVSHTSDKFNNMSQYKGFLWNFLGFLPFMAAILAAILDFLNSITRNELPMISYIYSSDKF